MDGLTVTLVLSHHNPRLLKACGSRLTEKLLEGAPTEDTLVLIERQTGWHVLNFYVIGSLLILLSQFNPGNLPLVFLQVWQMLSFTVKKDPSPPPIVPLFCLYMPRLHWPLDEG